jgi:hypothetical protein
VREAVDAVSVDGMSGEETDREVSGREKQLARVPMHWIDSELVDLFHTMDTWQSMVTDESLVCPHGNRPLTQLHASKEPVVGHVTKGLPRNLYDDTWYKSQSGPQKLLLSTRLPRPIPSLVCFLFFLYCPHHSDSTATTPVIINRALWYSPLFMRSGLMSGPHSGPMSGPIVAHSLFSSEII